MGNISVVASQSAPVVVANDVEVRDAPSDSKFNQSKGGGKILLNVEADVATKGVANQISDKVITLPDSSINEEDMTTEKLAPFFEKNEQKLYLKGGSEDTYVVKGTESRGDKNYDEIIKKLPYAMSSDGEVKAKPAGQFDRMNKVAPLPYVESDHYVSEKEITKALKNDEFFFPKSYWEKKESYESLVEDTSNATTMLGSAGGLVVGTGLGALTSPVTGVVGPVVGGTAGSITGGTIGGVIGEDYVAPALHYLGTSEKELKREEFREKMKEVYQARFHDKWEHVDVAKTLELLPPGVQREAFYEAYMERPKLETYYSVQERSGLFPTIDKSGNKGHLLPGSDPDKRPNIGASILGGLEPAVIVGVNLQGFNISDFKTDLKSRSKSLNLTPKAIDRAAELLTELQKAKMPVAPIVELYYDVNTGGTNLIVYVRPNQVADLISNKKIGKQIEREIQKLPMQLRGMKQKDSQELENLLKKEKETISKTEKKVLKEKIAKLSGDKFGLRTEELANPINKSFRVSIPIRGSSINSVKDAFENLNVGYYFERTFFKEDNRVSKAQDSVTQASNTKARYRQGLYDNVLPGTKAHLGLVVRTKPNVKGAFVYVGAYTSNEGKMPESEEDKAETLAKENKKSFVSKALRFGSRTLTPVKAVVKGIGVAATTLADGNIYAAGGVFMNIGSVDPSGKIINEDGHPVYTTNVKLSLTTGSEFIATSSETDKSSYHTLPEGFTDMLDLVSSGSSKK